MHKIFRKKKKYGGRDRAISTVIIVRISRLLAVFVLLVWGGVFYQSIGSAKRDNARMLSHDLDNLGETVTGYLNNILIQNSYTILAYGAGEGELSLYDLTESDISDSNGDGIIETVDVNDHLRRIKRSWFFEEITLIDPDGVIIYSSDDAYVGYDLNHVGADNKQARDFLTGTLRDGMYVQGVMKRSSDDTLIQYIGIKFEKDCWLGKEGSILQTGWKPEDVQETRLDNACVFVENASVGTEGSLLVLKREPEANGRYKICGKKGMIPYRGYLKSVKDEYISFPAVSENPREMFSYEYNDTKYYCMYDVEDNFIYAAMIPEREVYSKVNARNIQFLVAILGAFGLIGIMVLKIMRKEVFGPVNRLTDSLNAISEGDLDVRMDVTDNEEFSMLSDDINILVLTLKKYIKEAEERIDKELALAKAIQISSIPHIFPPYPDRKEFSIYAYMDTAKEVGGDFYDFFFIDNDHLVLVIADVSNKGIPAAMFMMQVKAGIRGRAIQGGRPSEILKDVNNALCGENDEKMFVTLWIAIVELPTGNVLEANAGHEHPALYRDGSYRLVKYPHSPPLAVMPDVPFVDRQFLLEPGDKLFVYTDGVTEAKNADQAMFGEDRLIDALNNCCDAGCEETIQTIKREIDGFVNGSEQFDDITMCSFSYFGPTNI